MAELSGVSATPTEKKKPVKAQPTKGGPGGIFVKKVVAIWNKLFG